MPQADALDKLLADLGHRRWTWCSSWSSTTTRWSGGCPAGAPAGAAARSGTSTSTRPRTEGICDRCGGELFQRDDDKAETIADRLEVYADETSPLVDYYGAQGKLVGIDATGPVEDVTERAIDALRVVRRESNSGDVVFRDGKHGA